MRIGSVWLHRSSRLEAVLVNIVGGQVVYVWKNTGIGVSNNGHGCVRKRELRYCDLIYWKKNFRKL